jgi:hypothetical protein
MASYSYMVGGKVVYPHAAIAPPIDATINLTTSSREKCYCGEMALVSISGQKFRTFLLCYDDANYFLRDINRTILSVEGNEIQELSGDTSVHPFIHFVCIPTNVPGEEVLKMYKRKEIVPLNFKGCAIKMSRSYLISAKVTVLEEQPIKQENKKYIDPYTGQNVTAKVEAAATATATNKTPVATASPMSYTASALANAAATSRRVASTAASWLIGKKEDINTDYDNLFS